MIVQNPVLWFLGLGPEDRRMVRETAGDGYDCRVLDDPDAPELASLLDRGDADDPLLLWLDGNTWCRLRRERPDVVEALQLVPTVLVLAANAGRELLEEALESHVQQVVRSPLDRPQVFDALSRAREARNMYQDMTRMAREIMMGRELLERKSEVCTFLFQAFAGLSNAADARDLMEGCGRAMREALVLRGLHAVWWGNGERDTYLLDTPRESPEAESWRAFLRERAGRNADDRASLCVYSGRVGAAPETDSVFLLPLDVRGRRCGVLALDLGRPLLPGRDLALALDAVRRHLALVLWERGGDEEFFAGSPDIPARLMARTQRIASV